MFLGNLLLAASVATTVQSLTSPESFGLDCADALSRGTGTASAQVCLGEEELRLAEAAPNERGDRRRHLELAAQHYRKAATLASDRPTRTRGLNRLADLYDPQHLNRRNEMELTLKELIAFLPNELEPLYRLARLQEDQGLVDAAESTLLSGRHLRPDEVEPYKRLAQFYARRSTAMYWAKQKDKPPESLSSPGQPDAKGVYRVGGGLEPPRREGVAQYPKEAQNAGIQGAVVAEIVINEAGLVTDARVLRSIPFLDEAALEAVRKWRFEPTIVNGRAVPVTMEVTVNFRP